MDDRGNKAEVKYKVKLDGQWIVADDCDALDIPDQDGIINHFEFHNSDQGIKGLRRSQLREAILSANREAEVVTYLVYPNSVKDPMSEIKGELNSYRVKVVILELEDVRPVYKDLQQKLDKGHPQKEIAAFLMCYLAEDK